MKDVGQRAAELAGLKHAAPYIRLFKGKTFVVKAGGEALETDGAIRDLLRAGRDPPPWASASSWCTAAAPQSSDAAARAGRRAAHHRGAAG